MDYNFREIEKKWQKRWVENGTYRVVEDKNKKKFYVLNMFPYPSGAGLHVGHHLLITDLRHRLYNKRLYNTNRNEAAAQLYRHTTEGGIPAVGKPPFRRVRLWGDNDRKNGKGKSGKHKNGHEGECLYPFAATLHQQRYRSRI